MIHLSIDRSFSTIINGQSLLECVERTMRFHEIEMSTLELSIVVTTDENIQKFNSKYRGIDKPTDVLSFKGGMDSQPDQFQLSGDIIISFERATNQAVRQKHSVDREMQLLLVHGLLHLLGYDHMNQDDKTRMMKVQEQILSTC